MSNSTHQQENKTQQYFSEKTNGGQFTSFENQRSEAVAHQNLQEKANKSTPQQALQTLQLKANQHSSKTNIQTKSDANGLPPSLQSGIESLSGHSMDDVNVHYNSSKPAQLQAHAYAQGTDIHLAAGQEKHLPHEAWHVAQQKQGRVAPTTQLKGQVNVNDDDSLEKEADEMGEKALQMKSYAPPSLPPSKNTNRVIQKMNIIATAKKGATEAINMIKFFPEAVWQFAEMSWRAGYDDEYDAEQEQTNQSSTPPPRQTVQAIENASDEEVKDAIDKAKNNDLKEEEKEHVSEVIKLIDTTQANSSNGKEVVDDIKEDDDIKESEDLVKDEDDIKEDIPDKTPIQTFSGKLISGPNGFRLSHNNERLNAANPQQLQISVGTTVNYIVKPHPMMSSILTAEIISTGELVTNEGAQQQRELDRANRRSAILQLNLIKPITLIGNINSSGARKHYQDTEAIARNDNALKDLIDDELGKGNFTITAIGNKDKFNINLGQDSEGTRLSIVGEFIYTNSSKSVVHHLRVWHAGPFT